MLLLTAGALGVGLAFSLKVRGVSCAGPKPKTKQNTHKTKTILCVMCSHISSLSFLPELPAMSHHH